MGRTAHSKKMGVGINTSILIFASMVHCVRIYCANISTCSLIQTDGHKMVVNDEGNEMNLDKSKERHIGKFSYTPKESIENKGDGFVQSLIESDNAEVEEISVEEKSTHTFL